jgi:hypothetical protein
MDVVLTARNYSNITELVDGEWSVKQYYSELVEMEDGTSYENSKLYEGTGEDGIKINDELQDKFLKDIKELGGTLLYEIPEFKELMSKSEELGDGEN